MKNPLSAPMGKLSEAWSTLSQRERRMLGLLFAALAVALVATSVLQVRKAMIARETALEEKRTAMMKVAILAGSFREAQAARQRIEARIKGPPVKLFSYVEEVAKKQNVTIGDMQDRGTDPAGEGVTRSTVEVNFAGIDVHTLTGFLNEIERSQHLVKVEKLRLRTRRDNPDLLDVSLAVSTYQLSNS